ncbi:MAG TPA: cytochrome c [Sphingobium sp.]|nr:cytochrome c [Sphingobium sp.]
MKRTGIGIAAALAAVMGIMGLASAQPSPQAGRAASGATDGRALFMAKCGYCHLEGGTGTMMLERRLGKDKALLGERSDLPADYVKAVARQGLNSMPTITRVEVPDAEMDQIAAFIASRKKAASK